MLNDGHGEDAMTPLTFFIMVTTDGEDAIRNKKNTPPYHYDVFVTGSHYLCRARWDTGAIKKMTRATFDAWIALSP